MTPAPTEAWIVILVSEGRRRALRAFTSRQVALEFAFRQPFGGVCEVRPWR